MNPVASSARLGGGRHPLLQRPVEPDTKRRYDNAVSIFVIWRQQHNYRPFQSFEQVDEVLNEYIHWCWRRKMSFSLAKLTVHGIKAKYPLSEVI